MQPRPLRTKADIIRTVADHLPSKACERALRTDRVIVLGGFTPPESLPFWLLKIESARGNCWYVAVFCDEELYQYRVNWLEEVSIPWRHWDGQSDGTRLKDGDEPVQSSLKRADAWMAHRKQKQ